MTFKIEIIPITMGRKKSVTMRLPPSLNKRLHWSQKSKWNHAFAEQVSLQVLALKIPSCLKIKVTLINKTCFPMDRDNMYSSAKPLVDALVRSHVVPDDKEKFVDLFCRNEQAEGLKDQSVILELEIIEGMS